jgi:hypothetical protein
VQTITPPEQIRGIIQAVKDSKDDTISLDELILSLNLNPLDFRKISG